MKNIIGLLVCAGLFFYVETLWSQDIPFEKAYFKDRKDEFKMAVDELKKGDEFFAQGPTLYKLALNHYLKANEVNPNNSTLNYKIGVCYLFSTFRTKSLEYLEKAKQLNPNVAEDIDFYLGMSYHLKMEWDKAIEHYKKYKLVSKDPKMLAAVDKKIQECNYGKEYVKNPERVFIDNLGSSINTNYPEYGPVISTDESVMIFTSRRPNTTGGKMDENLGEYFEDLYISYKVDGKWASAQNMGKPVNTEEHDATVALSPDGMKLIIYNDDKGDGNLYECKRTPEGWSKPERMDYGTINTKYHESSASYSADQKTLYFVSNREGGFGGRDIWMSKYDEKKKKWGEPINLGPNINTKYDEESVLIHPDGVTLYFSSQGHTSMGGYDIFKSELKNGVWQKPQNLGYPINTPDDDVFFVINASGRRGYYASFKPDGYGEKDIYMITFLGPEKPVMIQTEDNLIASKTAPVKEKIIEKPVEITTRKLTLLKGYIKDQKTMKPVLAEIELIDIDDNVSLATFNNDASTGKYLVTLPSGNNYGIAVKSKGYLFHSENFNIPEETAFREINKDIYLQPLEPGSKVILKNIFYDYNKATLRPESMSELDRVVELLKNNPTLKVELSAHTDSRGSDAYNQKLSEQRAQSCVDYLISKGIDPSRVVAKGYGETQPVITDAEINKLKTEEEKEEAHQQNRRTEIKVIAI